MILYKTRVNNLLRKIFIKNYKEILLQFMPKTNKAEQIMKKIILKDNITTTYIENKHKNNETSALIHPRNVEQQLKPSFRLSVEI